MPEVKPAQPNLDVPLSTRASEATLAEIKEKLDRIPQNPAREDGNLALTQRDINDLLQILKQLVQTPLGRLAIDSTGRLRIIIDVAGAATPVSQSGTWTISAGGVFPVDQRWEIIQRANIEYNECQRSKFTFT